jgi:mono/diheme cytochrome c family protein
MTARIALAALAAALVGGSPVWAADGAEIFKSQCAKCHGETGTGDTAAGKALKVPSLVGDAHVQKMTATEVAERIKSNEKHPPTVKQMSDADIEAAAAVAKELAGK